MKGLTTLFSYLTPKRKPPFLGVLIAFCISAKRVVIKRLVGG